MKFRTMKGILQGTITPKDGKAARNKALKQARRMIKRAGIIKRLV